MTDRYLKKIRDALSASPFVAQPILSVDDRGEVWFVRADIYFIDNSLLHFRELFIGSGRRVKKAYIPLPARRWVAGFSLRQRSAFFQFAYCAAP